MVTYRVQTITLCINSQENHHKKLDEVWYFERRFFHNSHNNLPTPGVGKKIDELFMKFGKNKSAIIFLTTLL